MIPTFFIVGAPRCGTSSLYRYLETHPRVFMSQPKEPHYFGSDLEMRMRLYPNLASYLELFERARDVQHAGEASVLYLYSRTAPAEILAVNPGAKIIVMLRDPVEMIPSLHAHNLLLGYEDIQDLGRALEAEEDRRQGRRIPSGCIPPLSLQYTSLARYAEHVVRYQETFGRDRVHCILFEDLRAEPAKVYDRTLAFLGLEGGPAPDFTAHNAGRRWRHPTAGRVLLSAYRRAAVLGSRVPTRFLRLSALGMAGALFALPLKLNLTEAGKLAVPPELRRALRERLRDDTDRLAGVLGRDLSAWSAPEA